MSSRMNAMNLITRGRDSWCYVNARRTDGRFLLLFNLLEWLLANLNKTEQEGYKVVGYVSTIELISIMRDLHLTGAVDDFPLTLD